MRIVLILAVTAAAAPMGAPVAAQPSTATSVHRGTGFMAPGPSQGWRARTDFRRGMTSGWGSRRDRHPGRHHRRFRDDDFLQSFGFAESFGLADPHGNGFFAGAGGEIRLRAGRPYYDYDRSYPYEWASSAAGSLRWSVDDEEVRREAERSLAFPHCSIERGVRVCRGR